MWLEPITDRTADDIVNRTAKAFLNVADWLRIRGNTLQAQAVVNILMGLNVQVSDLASPAITTWPSASEINDLIGDIDTLREAAHLPASTGLVELKHDYLAGAGAVAPDYTDVNDWEQDLLLVRDGLAQAASYLVYCGVSGCGQARYWQARFRAWPGYVPPAASPVRRPLAGIAVAGSGYLRQNKFRRYSSA